MVGGNVMKKFSPFRLRKLSTPHAFLLFQSIFTKLSFHEKKIKKETKTNLNFAKLTLLIRNWLSKKLRQIEGT